MSRPTDTVDIRLVSKVSSLYYHLDFNQQEIADRLHLSRPKVSRLLKQARESGIVQITVTVPNGNFIGLETRIEKKYNLKEVLIVETDITENVPSGQAVKRQLGIAAANYLHRTVSEGDIIGVTWGTTLEAMIDALQPKPTRNVHIVQTLGGVGPPEAKAHAMDISRRLSGLLEGRLTLLPAPGIVDRTDAKKILLSDRSVKSALELFPEITTAYVGIGALKTNPVLARENQATSDDLSGEIFKSNAVGDIGLNFFDPNGMKVDAGLHDLVIGISLDELKKIHTVVGIAGGEEKFAPILGALKGSLIDVLITDQRTAEKLLQQ